MKITNLVTQHNLNEGQIKGLQSYGTLTSDLPEELKKALGNTPSSYTELRALARRVVEAIKIREATSVHGPIGSPAFWDVLKSMLHTTKVCVIIYSHSERESIETIQPDGTVVKSSTFRFKHFIEVPVKHGAGHTVSQSTDFGSYCCQGTRSDTYETSYYKGVAWKRILVDGHSECPCCWGA